LQISIVVATPKINMIDKNATPEKSHDSSSKVLDDAAKDGRVAVRPKEVGMGVLKRINEKFGDDAVVKVLADCMGATKTIVVGGRPMEVPDYKLRLDSAKTVMQYQVGNPVTRQEVITHNVDTLSSLQSKLQKSPALRRAVGNMLGSVDEQVVDVTPTGVGMTEEEQQEATAELQRIPQSEDTDVGKAIRRVVPAEGVKARGSTKTIDDKFGK
jgi:hypothetical protein